MWISSIQKAIDYIETHLTENIDICNVAKEAYSSSFHFQRVFSILCGYTVSDYIRMRRLSNAAYDLINTDEKIINISYKYQYDTPESFTRAFVKFHGTLPSEVRKGANVKSFSKLSVKLILIGGSEMNYRIEKFESFKVLCRRKEVNKPTDTAPSDIVDFWGQCHKDGTIKKLIEKCDLSKKPNGLLGICFTKDLQANKFPYGVGIAYDGKNDDKDLEIIEIPAYTYAVFNCKGKLPESFSKTYKKIVTEFFPQNDKYEYAYGVELEVYKSDNVTDTNYECEIWIAVNEK